MSRDSIEEQASAVPEFGLPAAVPLLVDADSSMAEAYDVLQYAMPNREPSHTFVLVSTDGQIVWVRDYGAPDNPNRTMYVPPNELVRQIKEHLP